MIVSRPRAIKLEVLGLTALVWLSSVAYQFLWGSSPLYGETRADLAYLIDSAAFTSVLLFIIWMSGDDWQLFGFARLRLRLDLPLALLALGASLLQISIVSVLPIEWHLWRNYAITQPASAFNWLVSGNSVVAAAFFEELFYRGYC